MKSLIAALSPVKYFAGDCMVSFWKSPRKKEILELCEETWRVCFPKSLIPMIGLDKIDKIKCCPTMRGGWADAQLLQNMYPICTWPIAALLTQLQPPRFFTRLCSRCPSSAMPPWCPIPYKKTRAKEERWGQGKTKVRERKEEDHGARLAWTEY